MKALFDTREKIDFAVASFTALLSTAGWKLFEEILTANIEVVEKEILEGVENETKETIDRLRDKLKVYKEVRDTPKNILDKLTGAEETEELLDPFQTTEQLQEERKEI